MVVLAEQWIFLNQKKKKKIVDDKLKWEEGRHILVANPLQWRFRKKCLVEEMKEKRDEREKGH